MLTKLKISIQYLIPHHIVSRVAGKLADCRIKIIKNFLIRNFAKIYHVDMQDALEPNLSKYETFNAFFTRALKSNARALPANNKIIVSPVDGKISQMGKIQENSLISAKSSKLSLQQLLTDQNLAKRFAGGDFITVYLSPSDYHRVHMPFDGTLKQMIYVPGKLFSVNAITVANIPNVFSRNERLITIFESELGIVAVILIGALIVGSIETTFEKEIASPQPSSPIKVWNYENQVKLSRGEELGRFKLGSTVILLFQENKIKWENGIAEEKSIKMHNPLANLTNSN